MANTMVFSDTIMDEAYVEIGLTDTSMSSLGLTRNVRIQHELEEVALNSPHLRGDYDSVTRKRGFTIQLLLEQQTLHQHALAMGYPMDNLTLTKTLKLDNAKQLTKAVRVTSIDTAGTARTWTFDKCKVMDVGELALTIEGGEVIQQQEVTFRAFVNTDGEFGEETQVNTETIPTGWTDI